MDGSVFRPPTICNLVTGVVSRSRSDPSPQPQSQGRQREASVDESEDEVEPVSSKTKAEVKSDAEDEDGGDAGGEQSNAASVVSEHSPAKRYSVQLPVKMKKVSATAAAAAAAAAVANAEALAHDGIHDAADSSGVEPQPSASAAASSSNNHAATIGHRRSSRKRRRVSSPEPLTARTVASSPSQRPGAKAHRPVPKKPKTQMVKKSAKKRGREDSQGS